MPFVGMMLIIVTHIAQMRSMLPVKIVFHACFFILSTILPTR